MANPTTNKPASTAVYDSSLGLLTAIKSAIPFHNGVGLPQEMVNKKLATVHSGTSGLGTGFVPEWDLTGFPYTPNGGDKCIRFRHAAKVLSFVGGSPSWASSSVRSILIVFKHLLPAMAPSGITQVSPLCQVGGSSTDTFGQGLWISVANTGTATLQVRRNAGTFTTSTTLTYGEWYAMAVTFDDSAATKVRTVRLYRYSDQTLVTGAGGTSQNDGTTTPTAPSLTDFSLGAVTGGDKQFVGSIYCAGTHTGTLSDANFQSFYEDPVGALGCRGTYTASGSLTAGTAKVGQVTHNSITVTASRATGTGTSGTGAPTYQWQRATAANGSFSNISGATSLTYTDTDVTKFNDYYYQIVATDGSSTVTYPSSVPLAATPMLGPPLGIMFAGDSITESYSQPEACVRILAGAGRIVQWDNRAKSGAYCAASSASPSWSNGVGPSTSTVAITGGTPTSGKFNITISAVNSANINYNADAATVQSTLEAMSGVGAGNILVTGGPFPGTAMTITFAGTLATSTKTPAMQSASNTMNNSAVPTFTLVQQGYPAGSLISTMTDIVNADTNFNYIHFMIGTNDFGAGYSYAQYLLNLQQTIASFRSLASGAKVIISAPPFRNAGVAAADVENLKLAINAIRAVADGINIFVGDVSGNHDFTMNYPADLASDGIHPSNYIVYQFAGNWARGISRVVQPPGVILRGGIRTGGDL